MAKESFASKPENTVIGESILISGKLTGDEDLTILGRVEGEVSLTKTLIVEKSGIVKANVAVKNAIISGVVVGNINATDSIELTKEGRMVGDMNSPRVIIVDGASFRGRVDMGEVEPGRINSKKNATVRPTGKASASAKSEPKKAATTGKPAPPSPPPSHLRAPTPISIAEASKKRVVIRKKAK